MSKRKSNKKVKQQILSFLNRNKESGDSMFGYYALQESPNSKRKYNRGYALRCSGKPYTLTRAIEESYWDY